MRHRRKRPSSWISAALDIVCDRVTRLESVVERRAHRGHVELTTYRDTITERLVTNVISGELVA